MSRTSKAFTVAEMTLVLLFLGIMAFVAIPKLQFRFIFGQQADTVARGLVTDLRLTRAMAIGHATSNVAGFGLHMTGSGPYTGYEIINLDTTNVIESFTIDTPIQCTGGSTFDFGPLGNLLSGSDTQIDVSGADRSFTINIVTATGTVKCVEN
jgi:Tfp pilus assembly protein FimT